LLLLLLLGLEEWVVVVADGGVVVVAVEGEPTEGRGADDVVNDSIMDDDVVNDSMMDDDYWTVHVPTHHVAPDRREVYPRALCT